MTKMESSNVKKKKVRRITKKRKLRAAPKSLRQYLSFDLRQSACLVSFFVVYLFVMICIFPMLHFEVSPEGTAKHSPFEGARGQKKVEAVARKLREKFRKLRGDQGLTDQQLMGEAIQEFNIIRSKKSQNRDKATQKFEQHLSDTETPGVILLGMHRSGTSMLAGLMIHGAGFNSGGPLIGPAYDNAKGFFERVDLVLQNDIYMKAQHIFWDMGARDYSDHIAIEDQREGRIQFNEGAKTLAFLNDPTNAPWLAKDPRLCITLKSWLPLLQKKPAIVFTYRHPLEVAVSLKKREHKFTNLERGLRLWIVYNMRGIQNSQGLCRIVSSNDRLLNDATNEIERISTELVHQCGMPLPPKTITAEVTEDFIDPHMQHEKRAQKDKQDANMDVLETYNDCAIKDYESSFQQGTSFYDKEKKMYLIAMRVYCDLQSGVAFKSSYSWPELP